MREERPSSVRWRCLIFFPLSMNQPRLYRRLIIAKRLKRFFLLFSSLVFNRLMFAQPHTVHHNMYTPSSNSRHITSPWSPTVSYRRCTDNVGVKHGKSAGVVHQTPAVVGWQWLVRLQIPLADCAALFVLAFTVTFGTAAVSVRLSRVWDYSANEQKCILW